jgi:hypothetical protein
MDPIESGAWLQRSEVIVTRRSHEAEPVSRRTLKLRELLHSTSKLGTQQAHR